MPGLFGDSEPARSNLLQMIIAVILCMFIIGYIWFRVVMKPTRRESRRRTFNIRKYRVDDEVEDND